MNIRCEMDTPHEVVKDVALAAGAELHRFINGGGDPYSAIYYNGEEAWSCERGREDVMVREWNDACIQKRNVWVEN